ncbi:MAG: hypothetical protein QXK49_00180 [Candidatus Aenigmatarchaeota archaeon]
MKNKNSKKMLILFFIAMLLTTILIKIFAPHMMSNIIIFVIFLPFVTFTLIMGAFLLGIFIFTIFFSIKIYIKMSKLKVLEILILFLLIIYLYSNKIINSNNFGSLFLFFIPLIGIFSIMKLFYGPVRFKKKPPTTVDVIKTTIYFSFFIITIAASIMFTLSFENFILFPESNFIFENFFLALFFYLISDLVEPKVIAYSSAKSMLFFLSIPYRLVNDRKTVNDFKLKKPYEPSLFEIKGERLPLSVIIKSFIPFGLIYFLIFTLFRLWENRGWTIVIISFFFATFYVISKMKYEK